MNADHRELAVPEAEPAVPRGREAEERIRPVMNLQNASLVIPAHNAQLSSVRTVGEAENSFSSFQGGQTIR
jgi:hypothetical protein